mgnify:CR=1 FL=1
METAGKKQDVPGTETYCDQLPAMALNLTTGKTWPILVIENTEGLAKPGSLLPARAEHDCEVEGDHTGLTAHLVDQTVHGIRLLKYPRCF